MRPGDTLIVTKLDRLARSTLDMLTLITDLGKRGIGVRSLAERDIGFVGGKSLGLRLWTF